MAMDISKKLLKKFMASLRVKWEVAYQVNDRPEILERELLPFKKIKDNYTKMLLTMDLVPEEFDGVKKINVVDWLLGKNRG